MELIFKLSTVSIIKFALYIGIDIRRMLFFKNISLKCINEADFRKFSH